MGRALWAPQQQVVLFLGAGKLCPGDRHQLAIPKPTDFEPGRLQQLDQGIRLRGQHALTVRGILQQNALASVEQFTSSAQHEILKAFDIDFQKANRPAIEMVRGPEVFECAHRNAYGVSTGISSIDQCVAAVVAGLVAAQFGESRGITERNVMRRNAG